MNRQSTEIAKAGKCSVWYDRYVSLYAFQIHRMYNTKVTLMINSGFWMIMIWQSMYHEVSSFILGKKFTTPVSDVGNGGGYACMGTGGI